MSQEQDPFLSRRQEYVSPAVDQYSLSNEEQFLADNPGNFLIERSDGTIEDGWLYDAQQEQYDREGNYLGTGPGIYKEEIDDQGNHVDTLYKSVDPKKIVTSQEELMAKRKHMDADTIPREHLQNATNQARENEEPKAPSFIKAQIEELEQGGGKEITATAFDHHEEEDEAEASNEQLTVVAAEIGEDIVEHEVEVEPLEEEDSNNEAGDVLSDDIEQADAERNHALDAIVEHTASRMRNIAENFGEELHTVSRMMESKVNRMRSQVEEMEYAARRNPEEAADMLRRIRYEVDMIEDELPRTIGRSVTEVGEELDATKTKFQTDADHSIHGDNALKATSDQESMLNDMSKSTSLVERVLEDVSQSGRIRGVTEELRYAIDRVRHNPDSLRYVIGDIQDLLGRMQRFARDIDQDSHDLGHVSRSMRNVLGYLADVDRRK